MEKKSIEQLFSDRGTKYRIPIYQRRYVWNKRNWEHLWDDIKEKVKNIKEEQEHFTGVIVIRDEENKLEIVDGQQRLTTFQIILCAIRDVCEKFGYDSIAKSAAKLIKNRASSNLDLVEQYKLLPAAKEDREAFLALATIKAEKSYGLFRDAYVHFWEAITEYVGEDEDKMNNLFRVFRSNFYVNSLTLDRTAEAAKIFESLNGRGRVLAQFDHLRNNLFLRAGDARDDLYLDHWCHFNNERDWFSDEAEDFFLEIFLKAKLGENFNDNNYFDLYKRNYHKTLRDDLNLDTDHPDFIKREFEELERYSRVCTEIINCSDLGNPIWFYQFLATKFQTTNWHPLILLLKSEQNDLGISDEDLKLTFHILESYIVRCILCRGLKSIRGENHLVSLIREQGFNIQNIVTHLEEDNRIKSWPTDEQVESALHKAGNKNAELILYILFKIEREVMRDLHYTDNPLTSFEDLDREHVMPQRWETAEGWQVDSKDYEKKLERGKCLQSIGNLTLLSSKANAELARNHAFSHKTEVYRKHASLAITDEIINFRDWDVDQIRERACKMHKRFCQVWQSAESFLSNFDGKDTVRKFRGKLKSWQPDYHYAFIISDDDQTEVHIPEREYKRFVDSLPKNQSLEEGQLLEFDKMTVETERGTPFQARNVVLVKNAK